MNNTAKWVIGSAALTALATAGVVMNKDKIAKMGQTRIGYLENAKDDIANGMKDAAKDIKNALK
jgi:outer membrane murein-binding lipoprotein Lpp